MTTPVVLSWGLAWAGTVVVPVSVLDPGEHIKEEDLEEWEFADALVHDGQPTALLDVVGRVPVERLLPGEPIREERLAQRGTVAAVGVQLGRRELAVVLPLEQDTDLFQPTTTVDVLWVSPGLAPCSLIDGARVIGLGSGGRVRTTDGGPASVLLLAMPVPEAAALLWARDQGRLVPVVRGVTDSVDDEAGRCNLTPPVERLTTPRWGTPVLDLGQPADWWVVSEPAVATVQAMEAGWIHIRPHREGSTFVAFRQGDSAPRIVEVSVTGDDGSAPKAERTERTERTEPVELSVGQAWVLPMAHAPPPQLWVGAPEIVAAVPLESDGVLLVGLAPGRSEVLLQHEGRAPTVISVDVAALSVFDTWSQVDLRPGEVVRVRTDGRVGRAITTDDSVMVVTRSTGRTVLVRGVAAGRATLVVQHLGEDPTLFDVTVRP